MMDYGMLWFDNDSKKPLEKKIEEAAKYYRNKYGKAPNCVYVHPSMIPAGSEISLDGIMLCSSNSIMPNHLWVGMVSKKEGINDA